MSINDWPPIERRYRSWADLTAEERLEHRQRRERQYRREHAEDVSAARHRRRARNRGAEGSHSAEDLRELRETQGDCCAYCGTGLGDGGSIDHKTPLARGGSNWPSNLHWTCRRCNSRKGAQTHDEFLLWLAAKGEGGTPR